MKRLAINTLLSATVLAWSGSALAAGDKPLRQQAPAAAGVDATQLLFTSADRARLASWWQRWRPKDDAARLVPGRRLTFEAMSAGRTLPQMLQAPQCQQAGLVDVLVGGQLLRVHRDSRVVVDVLA